MYGTIQSSAALSECEPLAAWRVNEDDSEESDHDGFQHEQEKYRRDEHSLVVDANKKGSTFSVGSGSANHAMEKRRATLLACWMAGPPARISFFALMLVLLMVLLGFLGYASLPTTMDNNNNIHIDNHADSANNLFGAARQIENVDTGLTVFPWKLQNDKNTGQEYYLGYLEFCGNESSGIYSYRTAQSATNVDPLEDCGKNPAPVIRILPRVHYRLILINTSDEATNIHIHNMHLSGVGIVDDVTRQGYPGSCLVYEWYIRDNADVGEFSLSTSG